MSWTNKIKVFKWRFVKSVDLIFVSSGKWMDEKRKKDWTNCVTRWDAATKQGRQVMSRCCCYCCCYGSNTSCSSSLCGIGIASGISTLLSLVVVTIAISTDEWLLTEEKLPKPPPLNATAEPDSKLTYSGLWKVCVTFRKFYLESKNQLLHFYQLTIFFYVLIFLLRRK